MVGRIPPLAITPDADRVQAVADLLRRIAREHAPAALASSLSIEDMVLTDLIWRGDLPIEVLSLDTGRLPAETLALVDRVERHYGRRITVIRPNPAAVARYVAAHGADGFYDSVALRQACCAIRKVAPLKRALAGKAAWITGQRRSQSVTRAGLAIAEWDAVNNLPKFNPLAAWSAAEVWGYIRAERVPYSPLYDAGYASIGCAPCTRAIVAGEDERDGRWWWEAAETRECGLHPGTMRRAQS